jgi:alkylhydroperoxidase family enzyme
MRLPFPPHPPTPTSPAEAAIVQRIQARRAPRPLQPLDLTLLHSPPVADGWNSFLGAVRTQTTIPADLRELAISRVAVVNRAWYEWAHHAPLAEEAGVSKEGMEAVKREGECVLEGETQPKGLSERQWAVVCYADEMTRNVQVKEGTFERLRGLFGEREIVEITATVGFYFFFFFFFLGGVGCDVLTGRRLGCCLQLR